MLTGLQRCSIPHRSAYRLFDEGFAHNVSENSFPGSTTITSPFTHGESMNDGKSHWMVLREA